MATFTPPTTAKEPKAAKTAKEPKAPKTPKEPKESKGTGAPRPRNLDYGIKPEAIIKLVVEETPRKGRDYKNINLVEDGMTVEAFFAKGGTRHDLRVLSRGKAITIVGANGVVYPIAYVAPVKAATAEA